MIGQSLRWTQQEIAALSVVGESDVARAQQWWRKYAPIRYRALLTNAQWDAVNQHFVMGKPISDEQLKALILLIFLLAERDIMARSRKMFAGAMLLNAWQQEFAEDIKLLHINAWAAGQGGYGNLSERDFGLISAGLRFQYDRLEHFARQAEAGFQQADSEGDVTGRTQLYVRAGNATFENSKRESHKEAGFDLEINLLGNAEHCVECVEETDKGWVPIGTLKPVGARICLANCKCSLIYDRSKTNHGE